MTKKTKKETNFDDIHIKATTSEFKPLQEFTFSLRPRPQVLQMTNMAPHNCVSFPPPPSCSPSFSLADLVSLLIILQAYFAIRTSLITLVSPGSLASKKAWTHWLPSTRFWSIFHWDPFWPVCLKWEVLPNRPYNPVFLPLITI